MISRKRMPLLERLQLIMWTYRRGKHVPLKTLLSMLIGKGRGW